MPSDFFVVFQRHVDRRSRQILRRDACFDKYLKEADLWWTKKKGDME